MTVTWALFDLDGCLIDSTRTIPACINVGLEAVGVAAHDEPALRWAIGPPLAGTFRRLLTEAGHDDVEAGIVTAVDAYRVAFPDIAVARTTVIPGIPEVLASTRQRRAIVTSKPRAAAAPLVEAMGLTVHLEAVHGPDLDVEVETKAVTLARAMDDLGIPDPAAAVMIGDRHHDVEAGRHHGTVTIGVTWGAGDRDELEDAGADHVVETPDALALLLRRLSG